MKKHQNSRSFDTQRSQIFHFLPYIFLVQYLVSIIYILSNRFNQSNARASPQAFIFLPVPQIMHRDLYNYEYMFQPNAILLTSHSFPEFTMRLDVINIYKDISWIYNDVFTLPLVANQVYTKPWWWVWIDKCYNSGRFSTFAILQGLKFDEKNNRKKGVQCCLSFARPIIYLDETLETAVSF